MSQIFAELGDATAANTIVQSIRRRIVALIRVEKRKPLVVPVR